MHMLLFFGVHGPTECLIRFVLNSSLIGLTITKTDDTGARQILIEQLRVTQGR